ncbi:major facilitator superfamily domain-containing protein [Nemania abortiva]|nr:major facilitator superfamily domain-containing protein [Nemania abortiva]
MEPRNNALDTADETAPLLTQSQSQSHSSTDTRNGAAGDAVPGAESKSRLYPHAVFFIFALSFVADLGGSLVDTPEVRLLEMAVCRDYYLGHDPSVIGPPPLSYVDGNLCKINEIQVDLAYIRAVKSLLMTVPGLLLTIPYGRLADRIGRKPVAFLGMTGQVLVYFWVVLVCYFHEAFPTRLVLLSPIFLAIGGGSRVLSAIMATIIADVAPENMRTTIFYLVGAGLLVTDIVAAAVVSWLLSLDLWLPFKFSAPIICLSFPLIFAMPETLASRKKADAVNDQPTGQGASDQSTQGQMIISLVQRWSSGLKQAFQSLNPFIIPREMTVCLSIIFLSAFSRMTNGLFIQYTSKVLNWSMATAGYILSVKSLATLLTLVALACITQVLERKMGKRPLYLDVWVIRSSLIVLTVGVVLVAASKEPVLLVVGSILGSAGNGIMQALQGLLATFADRSSTGQLFAGAALLELLAQFSGSLAFAKLFDVGLGTGSVWGIGLPFYVSGVSRACTLTWAHHLLPRQHAKYY